MVKFFIISLSCLDNMFQNFVKTSRYCNNLMIFYFSQQCVILKVFPVLSGVLLMFSQKIFVFTFFSVCIIHLHTNMLDRHIHWQKRLLDKAEPGAYKIQDSIIYGYKQGHSFRLLTSIQAWSQFSGETFHLFQTKSNLLSLGSPFIAVMSIKLILIQFSNCNPKI